MKKLLYSLLLTLSVVFAMTGCKEDDPIELKKFTVTFSSNGGSEVADIIVEEGRKLTKPTDPTYGEFIFVGWFKESTWENVWNFDTDVVEKDMTLYAKWTTITYTLTFNTNGGSTIEPIKVAKGAIPQKPLPPTKSNQAFDNWYKEPALTNVYDFSKEVNSDITIYAKWIEINAESLKALIEEAEKIDALIYTNDSYSNMMEKVLAANEVLHSEDLNLIVTAYSKLKEAISALVLLPRKEVAKIDIGGLVDGISYVSKNYRIWIAAYAVDAKGEYATDKRVSFTYDKGKVHTWIQYGTLEEIDENSISFMSKSTIAPGETIEFTVKSIENPTISQSFTLKVPVKDEVKNKFIDAVNALPDPENISYDYDDAVNRAMTLSHSLTEEENADETVIAASKKLGDCWDALGMILRLNYSFKGNIATFIPVDNDEMPVAQFNYTANGTFPNGEYSQTGWTDKQDYYMQLKYTLNSGGTAIISMRTADDANGANATAWQLAYNATYTITGTQATGGMVIFKAKMP